MTIFIIILLVASIVCMVIECNSFSNGLTVASVILGYVALLCTDGIDAVCLVIAAVLGVATIIVMHTAINNTISDYKRQTNFRDSRSGKFISFLGIISGEGPVTNNPDLSGINKANVVLGVYVAFAVIRAIVGLL